MLKRHLFLVAGAYALAVVSGSALINCKLVLPSATLSRTEGALNLTSEFKNSLLEDISEDGKLLLLYSQSPSNANSQSKNIGELRVVDLVSGRQLNRVPTSSFPVAARFIPGTQNVFFVSSQEKPNSSTHTWNFQTNTMDSCSVLEELSFVPIGFPDSQHAVGISLGSDGGDLLVTIALNKCAQNVIGPIDPNDTNGRSWGITGLSNGGSFALTTYGGKKLLIKNVHSNDTLTILPPEQLFFGAKAIYSSNGKKLVVTATTHPFAGEGTKNYVLIYDTQSLKLQRRFEIPITSEVAIDPDGQLLAVGYTEKQQGPLTTSDRGSLALYNLATDEKIAHAYHLPSAAQRGDPFADKINRLSFTPDGKFLLSSTYDTIIWMVKPRQ